MADLGRIGLPSVLADPAPRQRAGSNRRSNGGGQGSCRSWTCAEPFRVETESGLERITSGEEEKGGELSDQPRLHSFWHFTFREKKGEATWTVLLVPYGWGGTRCF